MKKCLDILLDALFAVIGLIGKILRLLHREREVKPTDTASVKPVISNISEINLPKPDTMPVATPKPAEISTIIPEKVEIPIIDKMTKFNRCIEFILDREGRYLENNPNDLGGLTKWGISKKAYPHLDIANLTETEIKEIYYKNYWLPMDCDTYDNKLALAIFDCAVNQGVGTAKSIKAENPNSVERFLLKRLRRYFNLCQKNPKLLVWLDDWLLRVLLVAEFKDEENKKA